MAQDRPDLAVTSMVLFQRMANPTTRAEVCFERAIHYLSSHPRGILRFPRAHVDGTLRIWIDSDLAGDVRSQRSCSECYMKRNGRTICHWMNTQANVARSSGEAELGIAAKGISEWIGVVSVIRELYGETRQAIMEVDASACKGMLFRTSAGKAKHFSAKQLLAQGAVQATS